MPGRRLTIEYRPSPSVTAVRTFSISAGLATSTVTPGSTPPESSRTVPEIVLVCADAASGHNTRHASGNQEVRDELSHLPAPFPVDVVFHTGRRQPTQAGANLSHPAARDNTYPEHVDITRPFAGCQHEISCNSCRLFCAPQVFGRVSATYRPVGRGPSTFLRQVRRSGQAGAGRLPSAARTRGRSAGRRGHFDTVRRSGCRPADPRA